MACVTQYTYVHTSIIYYLYLLSTAAHTTPHFFHFSSSEILQPATTISNVCHSKNSSATIVLSHPVSLFGVCTLPHHSLLSVPRFCLRFSFPLYLASVEGKAGSQSLLTPTAVKGKPLTKPPSSMVVDAGASGVELLQGIWMGAQAVWTSMGKLLNMSCFMTH